MKERWCGGMKEGEVRGRSRRGDARWRKAGGDGVFFEAKRMLEMVEEERNATDGSGGGG